MLEPRSQRCHGRHRRNRDCRGATARRTRCDLGALAYFTVMEVLQLAGYGVLGACDSSANQAVTLLSDLHIVFQPIVINAFILQIAPAGVRG